MIIESAEMRNLLIDYSNRKVLLKRMITIIAIATAAVAIVIAINENLMSIVSSPEEVKSYIENKGIYGVLVFIGLQIMQIIVAFIPGEPLQLAGGYLYGTFNGFLLSTIGIMAGSIIAFIISRKFGYPVVSRLVKKEKLKNYRKKIESKKGLIVGFMLYGCPIRKL
jgi:uncharacterized membrane protein YdjX (TVP38/TMEM64 family)